MQRFVIHLKFEKKQPCRDEIKHHTLFPKEKKYYFLQKKRVLLSF